MYRYAFFIIDLVLIVVASLMAVALRGVSIDALLGSVYHLVFAGVAATTALVIWPLAGLLRRPWRYFAVSDAIHLLAAVTAVVLITLFAMFTINRSDFVARSVPLLQWCLCLTLLVVARIGVRQITPMFSPGEDRNAASREYVLLVGFNRRSEVYLQCVEALYGSRVSVVGILDDDPSVKRLMLNGKPVIGRPSNLLAAIRRLRNHGVEISRVVLTVPMHELSPAFVAAYEKLQAEAEITLDHFEGLFGGAEPMPQPGRHRVAGSTATPASISRDLTPLKSGRAAYLATKRIADFTVALAMILLLSPLYLILAALVAVDLGRPVTFWQERPGRLRRPFRVYKFRTMRDAYDLDGNAVPEATRLSPIGAALRRLRLDELPQLFNILVGNMSFVGPRPLLPVDQPERAETRLSMRPGLTGWAQINGGRDLSIADKGALDRWYVENAGLWVDLRIIVLTMRFVVTGEKPPRQTVLDQAYGLREGQRA